jgi:hypothetical protein
VKHLVPFAFLAVILSAFLSASTAVAASADCGPSVIEDW